MSDPELGGLVTEFLLDVRPHIVDHSLRTYPQEAVGVLYDNPVGVYPLINQKRSATEFWVSKVLVEDALTYLTSTERIPVAFYHSHPTKTADPSPTDLELIKTMSGLSVIHGVDRIAAWMWSIEPSNGDGGVGRLVEVASVPLKPLETPNV